MQTKTLFIDFNAVKQHFAKQEEANKDKTITYLENRNRGLKGEITKLKKSIFERQATTKLNKKN